MLALALTLVLAARPADGEGKAPKPTLAVLYFDNNTKQADYDVLRKGMADMMVTDLVAWDGVTVVDRLRLEEVLGELKLQHTKAFDVGTASKLGKLLSADDLLTGALSSSGGKLIIDAQMKKVADGSVVTSARAQGDPNAVFDIEQDLVDKVTKGIDIKVKDFAGRKKAKVPDLDALIAYSKAVDLSDQGKIDEANAAINALVSKSPAFFMARERKQEILKHLADLQKLRKDMMTDSVLKVGAMAEAALKDEGRFATLDARAQEHLMAMRILKGRFMMRALKKFLSAHRESPRVMVKGKEPEAINLMRGWVENQRRLGEEYDQWLLATGNLVDGTRYPNVHGSPLDADTQNLLREATLGEVRVDQDPAEQLLHFILFGRAIDGENGYTIAPALGDLDPKEQAAALAIIDGRVEKLMKARDKAGARQSYVELQVKQQLETKAEVYERLDRDEDAIAALQKFLDAYPTNERANDVDKKIKQLLGVEHDYSHNQRERWAQALKTCDDMDIRVGNGTLDRLVARMGLAGLDARAAELEKACKLGPKTHSAFDYVYQSLAHEAATDDDCDRYRLYSKKYIEAGGSAGDMMSWAKHFEWCELGDVTKQVVWFYSALDDNWTLELDHRLISILSNDKKVLTLDASRDRGKLGSDQISFRLEPKGGPSDFKCVGAYWVKDGKRLETKDCDVTFAHLATDVGDHDEGTFSASFFEKGEPFDRTLKLSKGHFRLRREN